VRLAVTADLHWGLSRVGDAASRELARRVVELTPDVLALAGDVGEGEDFSRGLELFGDLSCTRLVVAGNHDLWMREPGASSLERYERGLAGIAVEQGFHYLDAEPYLAPRGIEAVVGSINWYDYSFADPEVEREIPNARSMYAAKLFPRARHNDGRYVRLEMSDEEFTGRVVERFRAHLASLNGVNKLIVIQHHPPLEELFYPGPRTSADQRFWLAYTGNRRMQEAVLADPRITTVLCGHTHAFQSVEIEGRRCRNIGSDYDRKRLVLLDTDTADEEWWEFGT
jgi:predicted phosphohydrolase